ncbi:hypothetical protein ACWCQ0_35470 [Streptomyces massasporeus]|uniref:hypothetical protein n=1 Tax=Streptomyces massasporeus TaxID=67324 RepID=UPI003403FC7C
MADQDDPREVARLRYRLYVDALRARMPQAQFDLLMEAIRLWAAHGGGTARLSFDTAEERELFTPEVQQELLNLMGLLGAMQPGHENAGLQPDPRSPRRTADRSTSGSPHVPFWAHLYTPTQGPRNVKQALSEDELIRRLGADLTQCPVADREHAPFDPADYEESLRYVGVRSVDGAPGGCVITQDGYMPSDNAVLRAISENTTAHGVYFNPKGGTFATLARDGEIVASEEIGLSPHASDPDAYWNFRFWQRKHAFPHGADILACSCAAAGLRISDGRDLVDPRAPRRWVALPPRLQR